MNKTIKRTLAIVMAVAMLFALSATAFATQPAQQQNTVTAYIKLQAADVPANNYNYQLNQLTVTNEITDGEFVEVTVTKTGDITVKDLVNQLIEDYGFGVEACSKCDATYGCHHTLLDDEVDTTTLCGCTACECTWYRVQNLNSTTFAPIPYSYSSVLNSLSYGFDVYTNNSQTTYTDETHQHGTYSGTSWEYFVANSSTDTAVYPQNLYMSQYVVSSSAYITLSFDRSSFSW